MEGTLWPTFRDAADRLGLLDSDKHHERSMEEASLWATSHQLRILFALIMVYGGVTAPDALWTQFQKELSEDCERKLLSQGFPEPIAEEACWAYALKLFGELIEDMGSSLESCGLSNNLIKLTFSLSIHSNLNSDEVKLTTPEVSAEVLQIKSRY